MERHTGKKEVPDQSKLLSGLPEPTQRRTKSTGDFSPLPRRDLLAGVTRCLPPLLAPHPHLAPASSQNIQASDPQPAATSTSAGTAQTDGPGELIPMILPKFDEEAIYYTPQTGRGGSKQAGAAGSVPGRGGDTGRGLGTGNDPGAEVGSPGKFPPPF